MVTHSGNLGTGEAERKRRIAKSLWPVCHTQGTLGQPGLQSISLPHLQPLPQNSQKRIYKPTQTHHQQQIATFVSCTAAKGTQALDSASLSSTSSFSLATQTKGYENTFLFFCKGKVHWPDPPTGSSIQTDKRSGLKS